MLCGMPWQATRKPRRARGSRGQQRASGRLTGAVAGRSGPGGRGLWRRGWLSHRVVTPPPPSVLDVFVFSCFSVPVPQFFRSLVGILGSCSRQSSRSGAGHGSLPLALASARPFLPSRLSPSFHSSPFGRFPNHSFNPCLALLVGD